MERLIIMVELLHIICTTAAIFTHIVIIICKDFVDIRDHYRHGKVTDQHPNPAPTVICHDHQRNHAGIHQQGTHVHREAPECVNSLQSKTSFEELYILQGSSQKQDPFWLFVTL